MPKRDMGQASWYNFTAYRASALASRPCKASFIFPPTRSGAGGLSMETPWFSRLLWFSRQFPRNRVLIDRLRGEIVAAARDPVLFTDYGIEDSLEGRFEALALHAALVLRHLNRRKPPAPEMAQDLTDSLFRSFDGALREIGVGDTIVPKRMRAIAEAFLGRATAYDLALDGGTPTLAGALARNVYDGHGNADRLARYVEAANQVLAKAPLEAFMAGPVPFPRPSAIR
jgi:cytochrome b pre-mRNA-processing protein 3